MKSLKNMPESLEKWLILSDSVRCFENFWSLRRCFDLFVDKHKRVFSLVEKCAWPFGPAVVKFTDIPDWWNMFMCRTIKFWFETDLGRKNSASYYRQDCCFWLCSPWSRVGHALRPIFMLWLVKIWQLSSCGKFMQHLESFLLWQLKPTGFCVNLWRF